MSIKQAAWAHGVAVELETSTWKAFRQGFYMTVTPDAPSGGWLHIPIPTPVILDGARLRAVSALGRLQTGPGAKITNFHVYDGEKKIASHDGLSVSLPQPELFRYDVPGHPAILYGTLVCIRVNFTGSTADNWVRVIGGGIDFYN
jgi:hypothetical protein